MWAPTMGNAPPWTLPARGEPGVLEGVAVVAVVLVELREVSGFSCKDPQPLRRAAAKRENARLKDDRDKRELPVLQVKQS